MIFLTAAFVAGTAILVYKKSHPGFAPGLKSLIAELPAPADSAAPAGLGSPEPGGREQKFAGQSRKYFPARKIDINRASQQALKKLPNIGPAMAKRIIDYRASSG